MRRWEDIAKDKLEGYESRLPEGSLAEFRARRDGAGAARPQRHFAADTSRRERMLPCLSAVRHLLPKR